MARVLQTLTARSITYVTFSDSDALAAEHDVVLCLEAGGASARTAAGLPHDDTLLWRARAGERGD